MLKRLALQMWSVKDYSEKDFLGTIEKVAKMGYTGVEFAGFYDTSAKDVKKKLDELGIEGLSAHVGYDELVNNLDYQIECLNTLNAKHIVCPGAEINNTENALRCAEQFNKIGEKCSKNGLIFAYHNHEFEFVKDNGKYPMDVLYDNVDTKYVKQQPDVFWIEYAGIDSIEYVSKHMDRISSIHLKQLLDMDSKRNVNAGDGIIDFAKIIDIAKDTDYIYEQEEYEEDVLECMRKSADFLISK